MIKTHSYAYNNPKVGQSLKPESGLNGDYTGQLPKVY